MTDDTRMEQLEATVAKLQKQSTIQGIAIILVGITTIILGVAG